MEAARNGFEFYKRLQSEDGHWTGAYGGEREPLFSSIEVDLARASNGLIGFCGGWF
jgi:hypothetical protein